MTPEEQERFFYVWPKMRPFINAEYTRQNYCEFRWYWREIEQRPLKYRLAFFRKLNRHETKLAKMAINVFRVQTCRNDMYDFKPEEMGFCVCRCARCNKLCKPIRSSCDSWPIQKVEEYDRSKVSVFGLYWCRSCIARTRHEDKQLSDVKKIRTLCNKLMRKA